MTYLLVSGIVALVFAVLLLFSPNLIKKFSANVFDSIGFELDERIKPYRIVIGILLLIASAWLFYETRSTELSAFFQPIWILALVFGALYIFLPSLLNMFSGAANRNVATIDDFVLKFRKVVGIVILLASLYIFYVAFIIS